MPVPRRFGLLIVLALFGFTCPARADIYAEIRAEALAPNSDTNHPLPLFASWDGGNFWYYANVGSQVPTADLAGFTPDWVLQTIGQGRHLMPFMTMPAPGMEIDGPSNCCAAAYYQTAVAQAAARNLPLNFIGTQWEQELYTNPAYRDLPYDQNPNAFSPSGMPLAPYKLSPFGPIDPWYQVGLKWGSSPMMRQVENLYSNPPLVIFISNNESSRLTWTEAETDKHYLDLYGVGKSAEFKRQAFADAWIARYRKLQQGIRDGLTNSVWKANSRFFGYEAFGPAHLGRWSGWADYSLATTNRIDPNALMWDGGSPSFYYADYGVNADYKVYSPAMESMNWEFMQKEAHQLNPNFWFEISAWAGGDSVKQLYAAQGQSWTPDRYAGSVQFGMWLERPRIVRDFHYSGSWADPRSYNLPWMEPVMAAVDRVYSNSVLQRFWRQGQLVANTSRPHPYQAAIPPEYASAQRMFLLNTNLDPPQPWAPDTALPVFSLARVVGTAPSRQWLVYAFSPQQDRSNVSIAIPDYKTIALNATQKGAFYLIDEVADRVTLQADTVASPCDVNGNSATDVLDVQLAVNQSLQLASCNADLNKDGLCNVVDIQRVVNAALGGACVSP